jgi:hypothetical protein
MRKGFLGSLAAWLLGAGLALAQMEETIPSQPAPTPSAPSIDPKTSSGLPEYGPAVPLGGEAMEGMAPSPSCCGGSAYPRHAIGPDGNYWLTGEALLWYTKKSQVPPLITTGPLSSSGFLGQPGTQILAGGTGVDTEEQAGGRFSFGLWLTDYHKFGAEFNYFFLGSRGMDFTAHSAGDILLTRPFTDANTGQPNVLLAAVPGLTSATIRVNATSRIQGADLNELTNVCCGTNYRVDLLFGFRWMELNDGLGVFQDSQALPGTANFGARTLIGDQFDTQNRYYGAQVGAKVEYYWGKFAMNLTGKVALGSTREALNIRGATAINTIPLATASGFLALPSNSGGFDRNTFAVLPEGGINLSYQLSPCMRVFGGYTFLYLSKVSRAGDHVDTTLNLNQFATNPPFNPQLGVPKPSVSFKETDFWAHGASVGLEFRF